MKIDCVISLARLSFALSTSKIKEKARVVAMDLRGHGKTSTENELDLSVEVLLILLFFNGHVCLLLGFITQQLDIFKCVFEFEFADYV